MPFVGLRGFSPGPMVFPFLINRHFQIPISQEMVGEPCRHATSHLSLKFIYFMYLKLGADFSNCDGKKTKQKQLLVLHLPLGCDL